MLWDHPKGITYSVGCDAVQADEASLPSGFASATNCTKDSMAVSIAAFVSADNWAPKELYKRLYG